MELKQAILVRSDLKMPKGKLAAQVAHASVEAVLNSDKKIVQNWRGTGAKKVILKVADLKELKKYIMIAQNQGINTALIKDAGKTFFSRPTVTCLGIGPNEEKEIDDITSELSLL